MGSEFWGGLVEWIKDKFISNETINKDDLLLIDMIDDVESVVNYIKKTVVI
jgi:predicted Rossmann-fold nucleotide-binding protein